ncbi:MAG TPA: glycosyltransferase family A protein [Pyrinomonadaceae bacterium]|nr:glycosyltransferase family A protein [Pyrinomonadaceae bacterium]
MSESRGDVSAAGGVVRVGDEVVRMGDEVTKAEPALSVIVTAYGVAPYIAETLDSVFAQTLSHFEVILVNDGSPDTPELERALAPYIRRLVYIAQENRGAGGARNTGLRAARAPLVAFLDGDDLWEPTYLEEQLRHVRESGLDLSYTDALLFGDSEQAGRTYMEIAPSDGPVNFLSLIRGECNVITSGVVASRAAVFDVGLFDETLRNAQDFDLWARLARRGARLGYQRRVLARYRCREGSLTGDARHRLLRDLRITQHVADTYDLNEAERAEVERMLARRAAAVELERGKSLLAESKFEEARAALEGARRVTPGWKLTVALLMLRVAPRLFVKLAGPRLRAGA